MQIQGNDAKWGVVPNYSYWTLMGTDGQHYKMCPDLEFMLSEFKKRVKMNAKT